MELRSGYKSTEVGEIPQDWKVARIGDLGDVVRGGSPRPAGDSRYFNGDYIPWLTVASLTNVSENKLIVSETSTFLTEEGAKRSRTLESGTLIIANSGATLGVAKILGMKCCANDGIAAVVNVKAGNSAYVCHYINSITKHLRDVVATGNGQPNLNTTLIRELKIPFPSESEQRAIAIALSEVDTLLTKLDQLITKKRDIKQAAMQQLLTSKTRLPGFSGEWMETQLFEICQMKSGEGVTSADINDYSKFPCYGGNGLRGFTDRYTHDGAYALIGRQGALCGNVLLVSGRFFASEHAIVVTPLKGTDIRWLAVVLEEMNLNQYSESSAQPGLSVSRLLSFALKTPLLLEQTAIANVLSDMDAELAALDARREKTRLIKQGMMQELLTGKTRLV